MSTPDCPTLSGITAAVSRYTRDDTYAVHRMTLKRTAGGIMTPILTFTGQTDVCIGGRQYVLYPEDEITIMRRTAAVNAAVGVLVITRGPAINRLDMADHRFYDVHVKGEAYTIDWDHATATDATLLLHR